MNFEMFNSENIDIIRNCSFTTTTLDQYHLHRFPAAHEENEGIKIHQTAKQKQQETNELTMPIFTQRESFSSPEGVEMMVDIFTTIDKRLKRRRKAEILQSNSLYISSQQNLGIIVMDAEM